MATLKACVQWARKDGFYPVFIRVNHRRSTLYIKTDKMVTKHELSKSKDITDPVVMRFCSSLIVDYMDKLNRVDIRDWTCRMVVDYLVKGDEDLSFSEYARKHIDRLIDNGQERNARNYEWSLQHLERFLGTTNVRFSQLTSTNVTKWIASMERTNRAKELYPVCMRQVFRAATAELNDYDMGVIRIKTNPWVKVKIPKADRPEQRAISAEACRKFFAAPLPESKMRSPLPELGRDVAMMVLCLAGINTVDLYNLRKVDYHGGIIHYRRAKTMRSRADGAYIEMRVPEIVQPLFSKYASGDDDEWLFDFHLRFSSSDSFCANVNTGIRKICDSMGIAKGDWYCVYTFRHTWATIAQNDCGASIDEVAFGMNHSRERKVTRGYIKIDFLPAWLLNERVVDFVFFSDKASRLASHEEESGVFRLSPKMLINAAAFFQGRCLSSFEDIGCSTIDEVVGRLSASLPSDLPRGCNVLYKIVNCDNGKVAVYERRR
ncbi:MAG: tyrosine-type recombinase/integrase [Candidatus Limisoma sp.]